MSNGKMRTDKDATLMLSTQLANREDQRDRLDARDIAELTGTPSSNRPPREGSWDDIWNTTD